MNSDASYARIRSTLKSELQRHRGHIRDIEAGLQRSEGYLSKVCRGDISIPLEVLLKSLELLDSDPARFFGRALSASADPADLIGEVAETARRGDRLADELLAAATVVLSELDGDAEAETAVLGSVLPSATEADREAVAAMAECSFAEHRRRLRATKKYRTVGFAVGYLDHLAVHRSHDPETVGKLACLVGSELIPRLEKVPRRVRAELVLGAALEYCDAMQMTQRHAQIARVVHPLLELCRPRDLHRQTGELWRRGGRVVLFRGHLDAALRLYDQAMLSFMNCDARLDVARLQIDRAITFRHLGDHGGVQRCVALALRELDALSPESSSSEVESATEIDPAIRLVKIAALQQLAQCRAAMGDYRGAIEQAVSAAALLRDERGVRWAQMQWLQAQFALQAGEPELVPIAQRALEAARDEFIERRSLNAILVTLELTELKLRQGRFDEATSDARGMSAFLTAYPDEPVLQAALVSFLRTALEGELSQRYVQACRQAVSAWMFGEVQPKARAGAARRDKGA